jgi:adenine phosphoribosyltransferase
MWRAPAAMVERVRAAIRDIPDHPKPGIVFKDITPLLANEALYRDSCATLAEPFRDAGITHVVAIESRGFLFGGPVAQLLSAGLIPVRKPGKLPFDTVREEYALEYGTDALEMHADAVQAGTRLLIVDDVLATGGTASATRRLVERIGSSGGRGTVVGCAFLIELGFLNGRQALADTRVEAVVTY